MQHMQTLENTISHRKISHDSKYETLKNLVKVTRFIHIFWRRRNLLIIAQLVNDYFISSPLLHLPFSATLFCVVQKLPPSAAKY